MNEQLLKKADTETLWALLSDITGLMEQRGYKADKSNTLFMYWYGTYKAIEKEIDKRLFIDYMEG